MQEGKMELYILEVIEKHVVASKSNLNTSAFLGRERMGKE